MPEVTGTVAPNGLQVMRRGAGAPLVLVHGYFGGAAIWTDQLQTLSQSYDVIVPELPGYGESAGEKSCASIAELAQRVLDTLSALGVDRFHLLGHSMGGMIVQQMAVMAPGRVDRLICYGTGPNGVLPNRFEPIAVSRDRVRQEGVAATARRIAATWFVDGASAAAFTTCLDMSRDVTIDTALAGLSAMEGWDGQAALGGITQKTLVIWGDRDRSYGWSQPHALWTGIAGSSLAVMPGCGHNAHLEQPALFNLIVENFLKEGAQELSA